MIYTRDTPDQRVVLQVVGRRVDISLQKGWGQRQPRTVIVAIGAAGSLNARLLNAAFDPCISLDASQAVA